MLPFEDRFTRQRQLPEVGLAGQERIAQLDVRLASDPSAEIEALYLWRAGVAAVVIEPSGTDDAAPPRAAAPVTVVCPHAGEFQYAAARRFGVGVHRALTRLRQALGQTPEGR